MIKTVGIITIHKICNFGSLLQAFATQRIVERLGYKPQIINYKYPNEYHTAENLKHSPYADLYLPLGARLRLAIYNRLIAKKNNAKKNKLFDEVQKKLLYQTIEYKNSAALRQNPPKFDIYLTGSDQVWNPRYMYEDCTYLLDFVHGVPKVAYSASFGTNRLEQKYKILYSPLLNEYMSISIRETSGIRLINELYNKKAECTCDPTLLLTGNEWRDIFNDRPLIKGEYILCYVLTYSTNPYPYASSFIKYIQRNLNRKVVVLDEIGMYWMDGRYKSYRCYGPIEVINLFRYASFIITSSFHGVAFSINFNKDFYSIVNDTEDERQVNLLKIVGVEDRIIRVGSPLPKLSSFKIKEWDDINSKLDDFRKHSLHYLSEALNHAAEFTK